MPANVSSLPMSLLRRHLGSLQGRLTRAAHMSGAVTQTKKWSPNDATRKRCRLVMATMVFVSILAVAAVRPDPASAEPIGWCEPETGDVCYGTSVKDGVRYVSFFAYGAERAEICVFGPRGERDCKGGRPQPFGQSGQVRLKLRWSSNFPNRGRGRYRIEGPPEIEDVAFEFGTGFDLCAPVPDTSTPGFASDVRVAALSCARARKLIPLAERQERRTRKCSATRCRINRTVTIQGFRCRFGDIDARSVDQSVRCQRGSQRLNWRINFP